MPHLACLSGAFTLSKYGTCDVYLRHFLFWSVKHGLSMCQIMLLSVSVDTTYSSLSEFSSSAFKNLAV